MSQLTQTAFESKYNNSSSGPFYNQTDQEITTTVIRAFAKDLADSVKFKGTYEAITGLQITQSAHGFVAKNVLTLDGSGVPVKISSPAIDKFIGMVFIVLDANTYVLALPGSYVTGLTGLTAGTKYFAQTDGTIGTTDTGVPVFLADTTGSGYVLSGTPEPIDEDDMASNSAVRVPSQQSVKAYVDGLNHFRGLYTSLANLQSAIPAGSSGDFADVDPGSGTDLKRYAWDEDEGWVVVSAGGAVSGLTTGRIPFATSSTTLGDDGDLVWDNTNKLLTVGGVTVYSDWTPNRDNLIFSDGMNDWAGVTGFDNFGVGSSALHALTGGNHNHAVGATAGSNITDGEYNELMGRGAGTTLTAGSRNVIIGAFSDVGANSYSNTLLGYNISGPVTGNGAVVIGADLDVQDNTASYSLTIQNALFGVSNSATGTTVSSGNLGVYVVTPTARLHLPAGAAGAGKAPLKLTTGTPLGTPEDGAIEYHGSHLYFTIGSTRYQLDQQSGGGSLSAITAASGTNTINNAGYAQEWQWNSLAGDIGLKLSSTSTAAASNAQALLEVNLSGANATSTQTTYSGRFINTHTGTTSTNVAGYFSASGGTNNYAIQIGAGGIDFTTTLNISRAGTNRLIIESARITVGTTANTNTAFEVRNEGGQSNIFNLRNSLSSQIFTVNNNGNVNLSVGNVNQVSSSNYKQMEASVTYIHSSGTSDAKTFVANPTINTTGGAQNIIGFAFEPSVTSLTGTTLFALRSTHANAAILLGGTTLTDNAILDLQSTTKAFIPPRMTTTQRDAIATPSAGMVIFNTTTGVLNFHNGSAWAAV